jgi:hypothetical protein
MADNVEANAGSGGATFATDDDGTAHHPYVKLEFGADNTQTKVSSSDPLPVVQTGTLNVGTVTAVTSITNAVAVTNAGLTEVAAAINASSQMDVNIAASAATVAVSNAGLTELAAAINASSQMDVNLAASNATVTVANAGLTELAAAIDTEVQCDIVGSLPAGTNNIGDVDIASIAAGDNNIGNVDIASIAAGDNNIGNVDIASAIPAGTNSVGGVFIRPETSNGLSVFRSIDIDETEEEVKDGAGQVYGWYLANLATSTRFIKLYNTNASLCSVGVTTPVLTIPLPGNSSDDVAANALSGLGITFNTGICVAATTGVADNDTGAPGANEVVVNIFYK